MLSRVATAALIGIDAVPVVVEVDVSSGGLPGLTLVGLPDTTVRESRERVRSAIRNAGFPFPTTRITVSLAPADLRKIGAAFDLPIALGVLAASGALPHRDGPRLLTVGGVSLDGGVPAMRGLLPIAAAARRLGAGLLFPEGNFAGGRDPRRRAAVSRAVAAGGGARVPLVQPKTRRAPAGAGRDAPTRPRRSGGRAGPVGRPARDRDCRGGRAPRAVQRAARRRQDHARSATARRCCRPCHSMRPWRSRPSIPSPDAPAGRRADRGPSVSRAAPHVLGGRADRRRFPAAPGRAEPGPPRRAVSRRTPGVLPPRARHAAAAARAARGAHRPRRAVGDLPRRRHARRGHEPVSVRIRRQPRPRVPLRPIQYRGIPKAPLGPLLDRFDSADSICRRFPGPNWRARRLPAETSADVRARVC